MSYFLTFFSERPPKNIYFPFLNNFCKMYDLFLLETTHQHFYEVSIDA